MEQDRILSQELEGMRSQIASLRNRLEEQSIINETHLRNSMRTKAMDINRFIVSGIIAGAFALPYCTWFIWKMELSMAFTICTFIMIAASIVMTVIQKVRFNDIDLSGNDLTEAAKQTSMIRKHYLHWHRIGIPVIVLWLGWFIYEVIRNLGTGPYVIWISSAAIIGGIIGIAIGFSINRKVARKTGELLDQIDELQKEVKG